jgi:hypothetical protein
MSDGVFLTFQLALVLYKKRCFFSVTLVKDMLLLLLNVVTVLIVFEFIVGILLFLEILLVISGLLIIKFLDYFFLVYCFFLNWLLYYLWFDYYCWFFNLRFLKQSLLLLFLKHFLLDFILDLFLIIPNGRQLPYLYLSIFRTRNQLLLFFNPKHLCDRSSMSL